MPIYGDLGEEDSLAGEFPYYVPGMGAVASIPSAILGGILAAQQGKDLYDYWLRHGKYPDDALGGDIFGAIPQIGPRPTIYGPLDEQAPIQEPSPIFTSVRPDETGVFRTPPYFPTQGVLSTSIPQGPIFGPLQFPTDTGVTPVSVLPPQPPFVPPTILPPPVLCCPIS